MSEAVLFHGGVPGLWVGDVLLPNMAHARFVDGCVECEAHKRGESIGDPVTPSNWVYATSDRHYARYYASRAVKGTLYRVRLEGDVERSNEDPFPTWRARRAIVLGVPERNITMTMKQRRCLFLRWGGTSEEFDAMIAKMTSPVRTGRAPLGEGR